MAGWWGVFLRLLIFGSLLPAVAWHALADAGQGVVAWLVLREVQGEDEAIADLPGGDGHG